MIIQEQELHIWQVNLTENSGISVKTAQMILSAEEKARGDRLFSSELQRRFYMAHAWKRYILGKYCQLSPENLSFVTGFHGKPYLLDSKNSVNHSPLLQFNMAHSKDMALFAINLNHEVGVDVEFIDSNVSYLELAQRFFAPQEYELLKNSPSHLLKSNFYQIWTLKEAVVKALTKGLAHSLRSFWVTLRPDFTQCLNYIEHDNYNKWSVVSFKVSEQYFGAVALPVKPIVCYYWQGDDFSLADLKPKIIHIKN